MLYKKCLNVFRSTEHLYVQKNQSLAELSKAGLSLLPSTRGQIHILICSEYITCSKEVKTTSFRRTDHLQLLSTALINMFFHF